MSKVVTAFGRMNPPTSGHLKLIDAVHSVADKEGADHSVIVSGSNDKKKNPLTPEQKLQNAGLTIEELKQLLGL